MEVFIFLFSSQLPKICFSDLILSLIGQMVDFGKTFYVQKSLVFQCWSFLIFKSFLKNLSFSVKSLRLPKIKTTTTSNIKPLKNVLNLGSRLPLILGLNFQASIIIWVSFLVKKMFNFAIFNFFFFFQVTC